MYELPAKQQLMAEKFLAAERLPAAEEILAAERLPAAEELLEAERQPTAEKQPVAELRLVVKMVVKRQPVHSRDYQGSGNAPVFHFHMRHIKDMSP